MPMPARGPHLALRKRKGRPDTWVIRDSGKVELATGTGDRRDAEVALASYIAGKHTAREGASGPLTPDQMTVEVALGHYFRGHAADVADPDRLGYAIKALLPFWGHLPVSTVTDERCKSYLRKRGKAPGTVRRELNVLQAAINYSARNDYLTGKRDVWLPPMPASNQRALTRPEAARLLWTAHRMGYTHVARFILIGLYSGSRAKAILNLRLDRASTVGGWFDLERGVLHRRGSAERETSKRRPPARLPRQLWAHARRWRKNGATWAIEYQGMRVAEMRHAFRTVAERAGLGWRPTPHTLKHTAITWGFAAGMTIEDAAGYFGTSPATLLRVYWDKSEHWQSGAIEKVERMGRRK